MLCCVVFGCRTCCGVVLYCVVLWYVVLIKHNKIKQDKKQDKTRQENSVQVEDKTWTWQDKT